MHRHSRSNSLFGAALLLMVVGDSVAFFFLRSQTVAAGITLVAVVMLAVSLLTRRREKEQEARTVDSQLDDAKRIVITEFKRQEARAVRVGLLIPAGLLLFILGCTLSGKTGCLYGFRPIGMALIAAGFIYLNLLWSSVPSLWSALRREAAVGKAG